MDYTKDYKVLIEGDFACFTRPEFTGERVSYDFITPSAARNILQSIYWKPGFDYLIDSICILNEIKTINWRTNESKSKFSSELALQAYNETILPAHIDQTKQRLQRNAQMLKDVAYAVTFHIKLWKNSHGLKEDKIHGILLDRLKKGISYKTPYLGLRELSCDVSFYDEPRKSYYEGKSKNFGSTFLDRDYKTNTSYFFDAKMEDGIIRIPQGVVQDANRGTY